MQQWSPLDLAEGYHLALLFGVLDRIGVVDAMTKPRASRTLATKFGLDADLLEAGLELLSSRTNLVSGTVGAYSLTRACDDRARFLVRQYIGAYGRLMDLEGVLRGRRSSAALVDEREHARAFAALCGRRKSSLGDVVMKLRLNHVLDLGCGVGSLLLELSRRRRGFVGWGVDSNPYMCSFARRSLARAGNGRLAVYRGDCRQLDTVLPAHVFSRVEVVTAANLANGFFADGGAGAVKWLRHLKTVLPGRLCLIADYYGRLGVPRMSGPRHVSLHDWIQCISGQGVPPASFAGWKHLYASAGCKVLHHIDVDAGSYFVHLLHL